MFNFTHRCQIGQRRAVQLYGYNGRCIRQRSIETVEIDGSREDCIS